MTTNPLRTLTYGELSSELATKFADERRHKVRRHLIAFLGSCEPGVIEVPGVGPVDVVPVGSELELRRSLPELHQTKASAFVLGYSALEVPIDLRGRFIRNGRVYLIDRDARLRRIFAGTDDRSLVILDRKLVDSALGRFLASSELRGLESETGRVMLEHAYDRWLWQAWGLAHGRDVFMAWAATNTRFGEFKAATDVQKVPEARGLLGELTDHLIRRYGPVGGLIFRCWVEGKGRTLLEVAVLCEALTEGGADHHVGRLASEARYRHALVGAEDAPLFRECIVVLGQSVETALLALNDDVLAQRIVDAADGYVEPDEPSSYVASPRLASSWKLRLDHLGEALSAAAQQPTLDTFEQVAQRLRGLDQHRLARSKSHLRTLERAEMAVRLLAWLVVRTDKQRNRSGRQAWSEAEALASWYAQEGGRIDLARRRARGAGTGRLAEGVQAVLEQVDAIRDDLDHRFAKGLVSWLEGERPTRRLLPIDKSAETFGATFVNRAPLGSPRRLLVLLMDGMAWAQAAELLESLDAGVHGWQPIAFNLAAKDVEPGDFFAPVIANLPTTTESSRSAFFSGRPFSGTKTIPGDDPKRWAAHPAFANIGPGPLFLRGDFDSKGFPTTPVLTAIADSQKSVVAVVVNAIDDALKGGTQDEAPWSVDRIAPLRDLLDAALAAGRAVLFTSDHGNVSGQRFAFSGVQSEGKPRYRMKKASGSIAAFEIEVPVAHAYLPGVDAARGVVMISDDAHSYKGGSSYGEHGGASMAEVIVPTVLLGNEKLAKDAAEDPELTLRPVKIPSWWYLDIRETKGRKESVDKGLAAEAKKAELKAEPVAPPQLVIRETATFDEVSAEAQRRAKVEQEVDMRDVQGKGKGRRGAVVSEQTKQLLDALEKAPLFQAKAGVGPRREELLVCLEYLLERNGQAGDEAFAIQAGKHRTRAAGLVATLSNILNVDGYEVLRHDTKSRLVLLDEGLLRGLFGVG